MYTKFGSSKQGEHPEALVRNSPSGLSISEKAVAQLWEDGKTAASPLLDKDPCDAKRLPRVPPGEELLQSEFLFQLCAASKGEAAPAQFHLLGNS